MLAAELHEKLKTEFSQWFTNKRIEAGFTQEEMAEKLNVTRQTISNWEAGRSRPLLFHTSWKIILKTFKCNFEDIPEDTEV